jgi:hypothetical protein
MTIEQLEKMKTHELADLLANVVLLLRRMPNVECKQLIQQIPGNGHIKQAEPERIARPRSTFTREELAKRKLPELKTLAKELNVLFSASTKKDDLIYKILARPADGHSEQRAIQDL